MGVTDSGLARPRALRRGDSVAVIAPSSPFERRAFDEGLKGLVGLGFVPVYDERVFAQDDYLAGDGRLRAASFLEAWRHPSVRALFAARGGYGSVHLLEHLDLGELGRTPKILVGYSDLTALLAALCTRAGLVCFHGPMVAGRIAAGVDAFDLDAFKRVLMRPEPAGDLGDGAVEVIRRGTAEGPLHGGNLTVLAASIGTPWAFDPPHGCVLFLEDVNERPYRLDRLLTQLRLAGVLDRAVALVFGQMRGCDEPGTTGTARAAIERVIARFHGPVLFSFPAGHTGPGRPAVTLPLGVTVRVIAASRASLSAEEAAVDP